MNTLSTVPSLDQLVAELNRTRSKRRFQSVLRAIFVLFVLIVLAALTASFLFLSVVRVEGSSMLPTLQNGDILVVFKDSEVSKGDLVAFYYNDKLLVKRVAAQEGDLVSILPDGSVSVNDETLSEPYVSSMAMGDCDITFPYTVPDERLFVLGDERAVSLDSRHTAIGCVAPEQIVGRVVLRVWPPQQISLFQPTE